MPAWLSELLAITALLAVIVLVVVRLPRVDLGHSKAFVRRRFANWFPVGLTYAFLYMGRYNLNACIDKKDTLLLFEKAQYFDIDKWGALTYGISFVINGPLTDKLGGRKTTIIAAVGSAFANVAMGLLAYSAMKGGHFIPKDARAAVLPMFALLYAVNMYFQSFGAVSIVKVNSAWFHLRERGTFGGIFGILISLGLYFAFDWCSALVKAFGPTAAFFVPAAILLVFACIDAVVVRDTPGDAGHADFDLGDATQGERLPLLSVVKLMFSNGAILAIAAVELCSGYLRNAILKTYKPFAEDTGRAATDFVQQHWGILNCMAGILGGVVAGMVSDRLFQSRRGPVSAVLYSMMVVGAVLMFFTMGSSAVGWVLIGMTLAIIGVHGMLSGTASMDFGGKRNVGVVVGVIDGCVYLGSTLGSYVLSHVLPSKPQSQSAAAWWTWPTSILPVAVLGFLLALRLWNAKPKGATPAAH